MTDVHFAAGVQRGQHRWRLESEAPNGKLSLAEAVGNATKDQHVSVLLVTGDFSFLSSAEEFAEAKASVSRLIGILGLGLEHVVVVPGNHDIKWTKDPSDSYDPSVGVDQAPAIAQEQYRKFFKELFRVEAHHTLAMARRYVFPRGILVEIGAVNSSSLEQGKNFLAGMGRVRGGGFDEIAATLNWTEDEPSYAFRILGLHHHLSSTEDIENPAEYSKGFGIAIDARNTQKRCARARVHLVVHGHRHRSFIGRNVVCELPEENNDKWNLGTVSIVGGGSAGSTDVPNATNFFGLIKIDARELTVAFHRSKNGDDFNKQPSSTWYAPITLENGQLLLGDWEHHGGEKVNSSKI